MEFKTTDTESIASIIKAVDDAKKKDVVDKAFDWLMRIAMIALIGFGANLFNKFERYSDQINTVGNQVDLMKKDVEYLRKDVSDLEKSVEKLTEGK